MDRLGEMFEYQLEFQVKLAKGEAYPPQDEAKLMVDIMTSAYALTDEIHEATNEVGWKPWATSNHIHREAYKGELVDAFHFFMNLCLLGGITADDLYDGYLTKISTNHRRQKEGYDGISNKCPHCQRALDDPAVTCRPPVHCAKATKAAASEQLPLHLQRKGEEPTADWITRCRTRETP